MTTSVRPVTRVDRAFNAVVRRLADSGVSLAGAQTLTVRGRRSGASHRIPVNPLTRDGRRFLVAPRGTTDWVLNARAEPAATLRAGRREKPVTLAEVTDDDVKTAVATDYLAKWGWEVGRLLPDGLSPGADETVLRRYLDQLPVFEVLSGP